MATTKTFKTSFAQFHADLKEIAEGDDVELFKLYGRALEKLAPLQNQLRDYEQRDMETFLKDNAEWKAHRATEKAKRIAKGDED